MIKYTGEKVLVEGNDKLSFKKATVLSAIELVKLKALG